MAIPNLPRFLYSVLLHLFLPFALLRLFWRSRKPDQRAHRERLNERFARGYRFSQHPYIWLHAVSVGETIAAAPLIKALQQAFPQYRLLITNTTLTGSKTTQQLFSDSVDHAYFPYDLPWVMRTFLSRLQPELIILMETEIWPNLLAISQQRKIPVILANARLSKRSLKRYQRLGSLSRNAVQAISCIAARDKIDAQRFQKLGAKTSRIEIAGNLKFDIALNKTQIETGKHFRQQWGKKRRVWIAASTHEGEDATLLAVHKQLRQQLNDVLLVLIPRHPERFDTVFTLSQNIGFNTGFKTQRRSQGKPFSPEAEVIIGDSMGEMMSWYAAADVVFMGGSLVPVGGHNPLEPASLGKAIISGSSLFNFEHVFTLLQTAQAVNICTQEKDVISALSALLNNNKQREQQGQAAKALLEQHKGASQSICQLAKQQITKRKLM